MLTVYEREVNGLVLYGKVLPVHEAISLVTCRCLGGRGCGERWAWPLLECPSPGFSRALT